MIQHFNLLIEIDVEKEFNVAVQKKVPELYGFMKSLNMEAGDTSHFLEVLCQYFNEDETQIKIIFKEEESINEICQREDIPVSPFIAVIGDPSLEENCILIIEKETCSEFTNFLTASLLWFVSFYVFDLKYPEGCSATAEFIQRAFLGINPVKGTKSQKRSRRSTVNAKVQKLVERLCSYKSIWI